jgi:hypothetical protein
MSITSSSANLSTKYVELLQQVEGVESVTPVIRYFYPSGSFGVDQVEGVEWDGFSKMNNIRLIQGHAPNAPDEIVIDETKAARRTARYLPDDRKRARSRGPRDARRPG